PTGGGGPAFIRRGADHALVGGARLAALQLLLAVAEEAFPVPHILDVGVRDHVVLQDEEALLNLERLLADRDDLAELVTVRAANRHALLDMTSVPKHACLPFRG